MLDFYGVLRRVLFRFSPETSHHLALSGLAWTARLGITPQLYPSVSQPVQLMGLEFANPVGLAAGLDKNGDYIDALAALGFGFIEIGTVTPKPQVGNPAPRLFRLPEHQALINRMGFNNKGVAHLIEQVRRSRYRGVLGINIGKNFTTPIENAVDDYVLGFEAVYPFASYVVINLSSPNTPGLRVLQQQESLTRILVPLKQSQARLQKQHGKYVPLVVKVDPDMSEEALLQIAQTFLLHDVDGIIATNTTLDRSLIASHPLAEEAGGVSGAPVLVRSTRTLQILAQALGGKIPLIGVGGICSAADAQKKYKAGARLIQLYTGFIYQGPALIRACCAD